jgi:hypothetical protein
MAAWQQFSGHIATNTATYVTLALAVAAVSAGVSVALLVRMKSIVRPLARIREGGEDAGQIVAGIATSVEVAERELARLSDDLRSHVEASRAFVHHVGLVRYDAFEGVGGNQSFSLCLLDRDLNGVILSCLTGKNIARSYAVTVTGGTPSRQLGDEEGRAMNEALSVEPAQRVEGGESVASIESSEPSESSTPAA